VLIKWATPDPAEVGSRRAVAVDVHAGAFGRQAALRAGQLEPGHDLALGAVSLQLRVGGACLGRVDEVGQLCFKRVERGLERVEPVAFDPRPASDGERPGAYWRA
jgi:hypothetical protein